MTQATELKIGSTFTPGAEEKGRQPSPRGGNGKKAGMKKSKKAILVVLGVGLIAALAAGGIAWSRRGVVEVQTGKVIRQDLSAIVTASGEIKPPPDKFATVNANSFGKVTEILVQEGDHVTKGQLLMRTEDVQQGADVNAQEAAVKAAEANASVAEASVNSSAANLKTQQANLAQAQAKFQQAKDDFARNQQLFKEQLIARQVFDQNLSDYKVAQAAVQSAESSVVQAQAQLQQATFNRAMVRSNVLQAKAQLVHVQNVLSQTIYSSPLDGIITSLPVHTGENVVPGIQNQTGSVLFQVSDLSVITAEVDVDETDIINVKMGQPAEVSIDAIPNKTFKGRVTQIGMSAIGQTSGQTTTSSSTSTTEEAKDFQVVITLDSPPPGLRPGLSSTAKITTATVHNAVTIPIQALTVRERKELEMQNNKSSGTNALAAEPQTSAEKKKEDEELQGVFLIRNGQAIFTQVKTGIMGTMNVQVLSGVQPADEIITGSYQVLRTLKNHAKIKVNNKSIGLEPSTSGA